MKKPPNDLWWTTVSPLATLRSSPCQCRCLPLHSSQPCLSHEIVWALTGAHPDAPEPSLPPGAPLDRLVAAVGPRHVLAAVATAVTPFHGAVAFVVAVAGATSAVSVAKVRSSSLSEALSGPVSKPLPEPLSELISEPLFEPLLKPLSEALYVHTMLSQSLPRTNPL